MRLGETCPQVVIDAAEIWIGVISLQDWYSPQAWGIILTERKFAKWMSEDTNNHKHCGTLTILPRTKNGLTLCCLKALKLPFLRQNTQRLGFCPNSSHIPVCNFLWTKWLHYPFTGKISLLSRVTGAKWELKRSAFSPPSVNITPSYPQVCAIPAWLAWNRAASALIAFLLACALWVPPVSPLPPPTSLEEASGGMCIRWLNIDHRSRQDVPRADE